MVKHILSNAITTRIVLRSSFYSFYLSKGKIDNIKFTPPDPWTGDPNIGEAIFQGRYNFGGQKYHAPDDPVWYPRGMFDEWLADMHSFSWLRHLKAKSGSLARKHARGIINNWLIKNNSWQDYSWRADILARRISAWLSNAGFLFAEQDEEFSYKFRKSLSKQARHLQLIANKSLFKKLDRKADENEGPVFKLQIIRGLLLSSICLENGSKNYKKALGFLLTEISKQVAIDGVHITRSPSIHLLVLSDLVTIRDTLVVAKENLPDELNHIIFKMAHALRLFRLGDGAFACFNGSRSENKTIIDKVLSVADGKARARGPSNLNSSGFERLSTSNVIMIVDTAASYYKYKSPHSLEVSIGKERMIGSCGPFLGKGEVWKDALSSTSAHSTLSIENSNAFSGIDKGQLSKAKRFKVNGSERLELVHYGYYKRFTAICKREIELSDTGKIIAGTDIIEGNKKLKFFIRFHFSPLVNVSLSIDNKSALIKIDGKIWDFRYTGAVSLNLIPTININDYGEEKSSLQLVLEGTTNNKKNEILWGFFQN